MAAAWREQPIGWKFRTGLVLLAGLGAALAGYMTLAAGGDLLGCGPDSGSGCSEVLATRWSSWMGLPVSAGGYLVYSALLIGALFLPRRPSPDIWSIYLFLSVIVVGSGIWFTGIQVFEVRSFCKYCLTTHASGLGLAGMLWLRAPLSLRAIHGRSDGEFPRVGPWHFGSALVLGLAAIGVLIAGQMQSRFEIQVRLVDLRANPAAVAGAITETAAASSANTTSPSESPVTEQPLSSLPQDELRGPGRNVRLLGGRLEMTLGEYPVLGSQEAEHVIGLIYDYTCPACRKMHADLRAAQEKYDHRFSIVMFPMALDQKCNPRMQKPSYGHRNACLFGKMGLGIWRTAPQAFDAFDRAIFDPKFPPTAKDAIETADGLVGAERMDEAMANPLYEKMQQFSINLFYSPLVEKKILPVVLGPHKVMLGNPESTDILHQYLEEEFGFAPVSTPDPEPSTEDDTAQNAANDLD